MDKESQKTALPSLKTRVQWFDDWEEATRDNRALAIRDREYHDNHQLTEAQLKILKERGQPPIVKNRIARKVNFILGEEISKRVNPMARPRTPEHQVDSESATDALRYAADEERFDECRSLVFKNMIVEGFGGSLKEMEDDGQGGLKHKWRHIEWDRLAYDPHSRAHDFGDANWLACVSWHDADEIREAYPENESAVTAAINGSTEPSDDTLTDTPRGWISKERDRIKIIEMFFRVGLDWYRCIFTEGGDIVAPEKTWILDEAGQHSVCPLVMESCYVDRDGNRYGVVRQLISPQDMYNKGQSKTLYRMSVNQVISETDAIADPDEFQAELAKPDGFATGVRPGALKDGSVIIKNGAEMTPAEFQMIQESKMDIDDIGPTAATIPDLPSSASGIAFQRRQQAASQELGTIFDQVRSWQRRVFSIDWLCIVQTWTEEKWLRITDDREENGYRFVGINRNITRAERFAELLKKSPPVPAESALRTAAGEYWQSVWYDANQVVQQQAEQGQQIIAAAQNGQADPRLAEQVQIQLQQMQSPKYLNQMIAQHPLMQEPITVNQVAKMLVDIVIDEAPDTAVLAQEEFATLTEMGPTILQSRPDIAPAYLKILLKASQLPNKRELIKELEKEPDQAQQQMAQQQQQMQQQMVALQLSLQQATIVVEQTKAQLQQAQAAKAAAETQQIAVDTQLAPMKAQIDAQHQHAQTLNAAADAGAKTAGADDNGKQAPFVQA